MSTETNELEVRKLTERLTGTRKLLLRIAGMHKQARAGATDRWYYCGLCKNSHGKPERYPCKTLRATNLALDGLGKPEPQANGKTVAEEISSVSSAAAGGS